LARHWPALPRPLTLARRNCAWAARELFEFIDDVERDLAAPDDEEPSRPSPSSKNTVAQRGATRLDGRWRRREGRRGGAMGAKGRAIVGMNVDKLVEALNRA